MMNTLSSVVTPKAGWTDDYSDITIDARWHNISGVGTYLMGILPYVVEYFQRKSICLLVPTEDIHYFRSQFPMCQVKGIDAKVLSFQEQHALARLIPRHTKIFYTPIFTIPFVFGGRIICTVHDTMHISKPQYVASGFYVAIVYLYLLYCSFRACRIFTVSRFSVSELLKFFPWMQKRLRLAYPGYKVLNDDSPIKLSANALEGNYFLYVGNAKPHKNLSVLLKAFSNEFRGTSVRLILAGKVEGFRSGNTNECLAHFLEGNPNIIVMGAVSDADLSLLYRNAIALVFPSHYEGFGLPPLESLHLGTPVIASNAKPMPEILGDSVSYFNPNDSEELSLLMRGCVNGKIRMPKPSTIAKVLARYRWKDCAEALIREIDFFLIQETC